ncbi:hypothetical protein QYE76_040843 [Lolium multiflorum]|uniref:NUC153 domain-containing protein n=1 Tax=Lolium multiflorum TaxID=4521 RepID=A0AAD8WTF5_LOLMU|nr:hypothetical protein QYE76_040843 [Lolium multiflorum]
MRPPLPAAMAPANSANLDAAKKGKKSNSKDERKHSNDKNKKATGAGASEVKRGDGKMKRAMEDERFAPARTDPRFRPMRRKDAKVALDSRFNSMRTDPMFASSEAPVDKRGRRRKKGARENPLLHCYLNQEEGIGKEEENKENRKLIREEEEDEQDEEQSSSSDDEEDVGEDEQNSLGNDISHYLMARHDDTPMIDKETHRLAVANMDWNHIKAVDLYMIMKSCIPKGGRVLSVSIYPTEFGLKCMNIETTQGPSALVGADGDDVCGEYNNNDNDDDGGNNDDDGGGEEDSDLDSESENSKIRTYELNRLRYYHAVVVCDSSATADHLYTTLDGTELMKTANVFDLRFIPDSMEFKHPARDVATEEPLNYKQPDFETPALQHRKVKLTWDDNEPDRKILGRKFKEDQLDGIHVYLAGSDSASDSDVDDSGDESLPNGVTKRKLTNKERLARLQPGDKSDEEQTDDQDMEITFNTELEDLSKRVLERKSTETKTVWEMHQEKMKEKRKARKRLSKDDDDYSEDSADEKDDFFDDEKSDEEAKPIKKQKLKARGKGNDKLPEKHFEREATREELELLVAADQDAANVAKGYNMKRKSKNGKRGKDSVTDKLPEIDLSKDPRFEDMFTSHLYALDPTNPQYKRDRIFIIKGDNENTPEFTNQQKQKAEDRRLMLAF